MPPLNMLGDFAGGGMLLAFGVLAALYERERSGHGPGHRRGHGRRARRCYTTFMHGMRAVGLWRRARHEPLDGGAPFYDTYETADGKYIAVGCVEPQFYTPSC